MEEQQPRSPIPPWVWVVGLVAIFVALQFWATGSFQNEEQIPMQQVASYMESGRVRQIEVNGNRLTVQLTDGSSFEATKESVASVYEVFAALGVSEETLRNTPIYPIDNSGWTTLFNIVLSVGPVLLLIWIFTRGFRQMQSGGNSIFGFGRSKAKNLNDGDRPTVTFDDVAGCDEAKEEFASYLSISYSMMVIHPWLSERSLSLYMYIE